MLCMWCMETVSTLCLAHFILDESLSNACNINFLLCMKRGTSLECGS